MDHVVCPDPAERRVTRDHRDCRESLARTDTLACTVCPERREARESRAFRWLDRPESRETVASPD